MTMERTWTDVGGEFVDDTAPEPRIDYEYAKAPRVTVERAIDALDWIDPPDTLPMMPGMGISHVIRELRIPKVSQIALSSDLAPYGFYGIEGNYKNGRARVYVLDRGVSLLPLASDFWPHPTTTTEETS